MNTKKNSYNVNHSFVGTSVFFRGALWRVISAHTTKGQDTPWLTLKRGLGMGGQIEVVVKPHEVERVLN